MCSLRQARTVRFVVVVEVWTTGWRHRRDGCGLALIAAAGKAERRAAIDGAESQGRTDGDGGRHRGERVPVA